MTPGVYHLLIYLPQDTTVTVGRLGRFCLSSGYYVYTGSALNGLEARVGRHLRREKRLRWHIDYLLQHGRIIDVVTYRTTERLECQLNGEVMSLPGCEVPIKGFGSSDCNCVSHLAFFRSRPRIRRCN